MKMSKKTIRMICFGPVAVDPRNGSPWEDVWLRYKVRRKLVREGPCFVSRTALESDIWIEEEMLKDGFKREELQLDELVNIKNNFDAGLDYFCDDWNNGIPNIYINKETICRKDIEDATAWYLREKGVLKSGVRFNWNKPDFTIVPVSLF